MADVQTSEVEETRLYNKLPEKWQLFVHYLNAFVTYKIATRQPCVDVL